MHALARLILACLLVSGCETLPPVPDMGGELVLVGRIKISEGDRTSAFSFRWAQTGQGFDAYFWGLMGTGATRLYGDAETLSIESRDLQASGPAEGILQEQLGWSIPVELLLSWVRGVPEASMRVRGLKRNSAGAIEYFEQQGWQLRFENLDAVGRYERLSAIRGDVAVLVVVRERMHAIGA